MAQTSLRLVGAAEISVLLGGVSRQRVYQLTRRADFPAPVADLAQGKVWNADDVLAWIASHRR
ncbi:DNA-binding protein [Actinoplanes sp. NBC_00393]|uniref:helix-turn-helix transcriptional regulator n=1 Tax=Actinoplanes sp. NBC_00393 TaxID=2975953 RepID=UPI002E1B56AE